MLILMWTIMLITEYDNNYKVLGVNKLGDNLVIWIN